MNYLTLDIGGSSIKYALLNETGEFIEKGSTIAPHQSIEQFVEVIGELYDKYAEQIVGMAISMPARCLLRLVMMLNVRLMRK